MFSPKYVELKLHSTKHNRNVAVITMIDKTYNIIKYKNDSMEDSEVSISLNSLALVFSEGFIINDMKAAVYA